MNEDGTCPYPDATEPQPIYRKVQDEDQACQDYLHPLLFQDLSAINRKRRRLTKAKLWGYLKQKKWRDLRISKGERIVDIWKRNYKESNVYYSSFASIVLFLKNMPNHMQRNQQLLRRVLQNVQRSPSYKQCTERGQWEESMLEKIERICGSS